MSRADEDERVDNDRSTVVDDRPVDYVDLVAEEAEIAAARAEDGDVVVATSVDASLGSAAQVFAGNARFRPIVMFTVWAGCLVLFCGVIATVSLLRSDSGVVSRPAVQAPALLTSGVAPEPVAEPMPCRELNGYAFLDHNGNGVATPSEDPAANVEFTVRDTNGDPLGSISSGADGFFRAKLATSMVVTVEAASLPEGLWPGPRLAGDLGSETVISGPGCSISLGFVWIPVGGLAPVAAVGDQPLEPAAGDGIVRSALRPGADGGVQLHGSVLAETVADRRFTLDDDALADITVTLVGPNGEVVAKTQSGPTGRYGFVGLKPHTAYTVSVDAGDAPLLTRRALGEIPLDATDPVTDVRTGDIGLPYGVWTSCSLETERVGTAYPRSGRCP